MSFNEVIYCLHNICFVSNNGKFFSNTYNQYIEIVICLKVGWSIVNLCARKNQPEECIETEEIGALMTGVS